MKFNKKDLQNMSWESHGLCDSYGFDIVYTKIVDTSRWSVMHEQVFIYKDHFYITSFSTGATEQQDESPYEFDPDMIECTEVFPKEIKKIIFVTKEKLNNE